MPPNGQVPGNIASVAPQPRSYLVDVLSGQVRRNRFQLHQRDGLLPKTTQTESTVIQTRSKTGTVIRPPHRYQSRYSAWKKM